MRYILLNAGPILLATVAGFIVSLAFAYLARRAERVSLRGDLALAPLAFLAEGWLACILAGALILAPQQAGAWVMALGSAVIIWIGFILPALFVSLRFRGVRPSTAALDCLTWLAVMLAQACVLHGLGLQRPG